jgi:hypothetical protein
VCCARNNPQNFWRSTPATPWAARALSSARR